MPEAAVYKYHCLVTRKDDVGSSRQFAVVGGVDCEAVAGTVEQAAELDLGLGVLSLYPRHVPGTALFCEMIDHVLVLSAEC